MRKIIRMVAILTVLAAVVGGGWWYYRSRSASAASATGGTYTQIVTVKQGTLNATISVVGQLVAQQSADLSFERMSGTAKHLRCLPQSTIPG